MHNIHVSRQSGRRASVRDREDVRSSCTRRTPCQTRPELPHFLARCGDAAASTSHSCDPLQTLHKQAGAASRLHSPWCGLPGAGLLSPPHTQTVLRCSDCAVRIVVPHCWLCVMLHPQRLTGSARAQRSVTRWVWGGLRIAPSAAGRVEPHVRRRCTRSPSCTFSAACRQRRQRVPLPANVGWAGKGGEGAPAPVPHEGCAGCRGARHQPCIETRPAWAGGGALQLQCVAAPKGDGPSLPWESAPRPARAQELRSAGPGAQDDAAWRGANRTRRLRVGAQRRGCCLWARHGRCLLGSRGWRTAERQYNTPPRKRQGRPKAYNARKGAAGSRRGGRWPTAAAPRRRRPRGCSASRAQQPARASPTALPSTQSSRARAPRGALRPARAPTGRR